MGVRWSRPEVTRNKDVSSVTLAQMEELIAHARLAQAPDDAQLKVDVALEIASPARVVRATFHWAG
jgi:hypothetical protein